MASRSFSVAIRISSSSGAFTLSESRTNVVHKDKDCVLLKGSGGRSDGANFSMRYAHNGCDCTLHASEFPNSQLAMLQQFEKIITLKPRRRDP